MWFLRRILQEIAIPTTRVGKYLRPITLMAYYVVNKPINYLYALIRLNNKPTEDCLFFFYDFEVEPITYDFAWALCIANAKRDKLGLSGIRIVLVPGLTRGLRQESAEYEMVVDSHARNWRIISIILPTIKLLSCKYGVTFCLSREEALFIQEKQARYIYPDKYSVTLPTPYSPKQAMDYCQKFVSLKADVQALNYISGWLNEQAPNKKIIVITLREYAYTPERNSNIDAWAKFAHCLEPSEFFVIFIPDTEQSLCNSSQKLSGFTFFHPACWNLLLRSALYEKAYLNLGVNTGPMSLCWLNPICRYITFKTTQSDLTAASKQVMIDKGYIPGKNPKFANRYQKWVWDEDHFDIIWSEFNSMFNLIESSLHNNAQ